MFGTRKYGLLTKTRSSSRTQQGSIVFLIGVTLLSGQGTGFLCHENSPRSSGLVVEYQETLDVVPVVSTKEGGSGPTYAYSFVVSSDGVIYILKTPTAFQFPPKLEGEMESRAFLARWNEYKRRLFSEVQILIGGKDSKSETVQIEGWGPFLKRNGPRLFIQQSGELMLLWSEYSSSNLHFVGVVAKRMLGPGRWSEKLTVTDREATGVSSFAVIEPDAGQIELLWSDDRERHSVAWWLPFDDAGYAKLFSRSYNRGSLGSVQRITREKGRYLAELVRARSLDDGTSFAVWDQTTSKGLSQLFMSTKVPGQSWSKSIQVSEDQQLLTKSPTGKKTQEKLPNLHQEFDVVPLGDLNSMVLWVDLQNEGYLRCRRFEAGKPGPIMTVANNVESFSVSSTSAGIVHLIYEGQESSPIEPDKSGGGGIQYRRVLYRQWSGGEWSKPAELATRVFAESVALQIEGSDRLHLLWLQGVGNEAHLIHIAAKPE